MSIKNSKWWLIIPALVALVGGLIFYQTQYWSVDDAKSVQMADKFDEISDIGAVVSDTSMDTKPTDVIAEEISATTTKTNMSENNTNETESIKTMLVAGGCFWCVEADLEKLPGVKSVVSGYAGGNTSSPTYENYAKGGHREVVEVSYDSGQVSFEEILIYAMKHMDPTDGDGSFGDRGEYYSPAFYYSNDGEKAIIESLILDVNKNGPYQTDLAVDIEPNATFWAAEDYHQDYYKRTFSKLKYQYYRNASGRDKFIETVWGGDTGATLPWRKDTLSAELINNKKYMWSTYQKPSIEILKAEMEAVAFSVTQEDGTERSGTSPLDKNYEDGIYVEVLSGEPLFSSKDKFDSGTGWPSFVKPITPTAVTEHMDNTFFSKRTEVRSAIADNHLGHVFNDGPSDRGGLRYCMNGVALRFIKKAEMEAAGYGDFVEFI